VKLSARILSPVAPLLLLAACGGSTPPAEAPATASAPPAAGAAPATPVASATPVVVAIASKSGSTLTGTATFTEVDGGVKVNVVAAGAPPGKVATHVHETGDCSAPDAKSAGGHFNPEHHSHALPPSGERHLGDLGNIDVGPDGKGSLEIVVKGANLKAGDPDSFLGRAIIVHEKLDDGGQPTGNAGGRIGCGVIAAAK
jgi:Cu-Zn family superoxide dismutase